MNPSTLIREYGPYALAVGCAAVGFATRQVTWIAMAAGFLGGPSIVKGVSDEAE